MVPFASGGALLERERELETLREGLDRACAGEGTLILIEEAGAGKTVLARQARAAAERARMMPLEARGSALEQPFAFGVVRQLLEPVISKNPGQAGLFAGAAGPAARLFEPGERRPLGADAGFAALHSLYWLVVNIADQAPVLVLVDDCQWADRDSLRFLAYLAQRIEGLPVTMLLTGRPPDAGRDEAGALWVQLSSRPAAAALYPRPLSESAAATLARERLGAEAAGEFCRACHTATGGNPLFLRELLRALAAAEVVPSAAAASAVQAVGPAVVSRFVLHRLAALGPAATELARAVAVLGDDSEPLLASRMSGLSQDYARGAADALVRADIFRPADCLGFVHPIVRAALYEDPAPGERQARHAAAAACRAALTGRKNHIQRRAHDRVHEPQALSRKEDVRPHQGICRPSGIVWLRPDIRLASSGSLSSPSTATARASSVAAGPSAASRCKTKRLTTAGPTSCTAFAAAADGATSAAARALSRSRRKSGLPPVAVWQARQNFSAASAPRRSRATVTAADSLSGRGYSAAAAGREDSCTHNAPASIV